MLIAVEIQGVSPLLCNRFHEAAQEKASNGNTMTLRGEKGTPREQAEPKLYTNADGKPIFPGPNVFAAIIEAGKFIKSGKAKLTTNKSSLIPAGIMVQEIELPLSPQKWEVDSRPVVVPATGGRIICHRPRFDEWRIKFTLSVDGTLFSERLARELVDTAGLRVGLGDFRPSRKGPFGRFKVTSWKAL